MFQKNVDSYVFILGVELKDKKKKVQKRIGKELCDKKGDSPTCVKVIGRERAKPVVRAIRLQG